MPGSQDVSLQVGEADEVRRAIAGLPRTPLTEELEQAGARLDQQVPADRRRQQRLKERVHERLTSSGLAEEADPSGDQGSVLRGARVREYDKRQSATANQTARSLKP
jgi:hypothetical protein